VPAEGGGSHGGARPAGDVGRCAVPFEGCQLLTQRSGQGIGLRDGHKEQAGKQTVGGRACERRDGPRGCQAAGG
jgi:hypothetical protein